jgi:hypothetical protein
MGTETPSRSRRLLTFRLDGDLRQRLKARLAGEGRTMSEVVIRGLHLYVQRSAWLSGSGPLELDRDTDAPPALSEVIQPSESPEVPAMPEAPAAAEVPAGTEVATGTELAATAEPKADAELQAEARVRATAGVPAGAEVASGVAEPGTAAVPAAGTTVVASVSDLVLPDQVAAYLCDLRASGHSDMLSAALARLHDVGWPLRPLAVALGISRQAVQARIRQAVPPPLRSQVPDMPPPSAFPRRRPALASGRRPHLTVKIDQALRSAAQSKAIREGNSLSQVIEKILDYYLRHGMPSGEVKLGDTTPTRPARPARRRKRRT